LGRLFVVVLGEESQKKYIVRLTDEERLELQVVVKRLRGSSQNVCRAQVLLKADASQLSELDR
jgi:hypothetical protein